MKNLILTLAFLLLAASAQATNYYIDGNISPASCGTYSIASRDCSGSDGTAYKLPSAAATAIDAGTVVGGDTVYIRAGTYTATGTNSNMVINTVTGTSASARLTIKNYASEAPVFQPGAWNGTTGGAGVSIPAGNWPQYITIDGLKVVGGAIGISISAHNTIVQNSDVSGAWRSGIDFVAGSGNIIRLNKVYDNARMNWPRGTVSSGWGAGIANQHPGSGVLIEDNYVYWNHGEGINVGHGMSNYIIRRNVVADSFSANIYMSNSGSNPTIDSNLIYQSNDGKDWPTGIHQSNGIAAAAENVGYPLVDGAKITNNILVQTDGGIVGFGQGAAVVIWSNWLIANNTIIASANATGGGYGIQLNNTVGGTTTGLKLQNNIITDQTTQFFTTRPTPTSSTYSNNIWYGPTAPSGCVIEKAAGCYTYAAGASAYGFTDSLNTDPLLVDSTYRPPRLWDDAGLGTGACNPTCPTRLSLIANYQLAAKSPALEAAVDIGAPYNIDFAGVLRPQSTLWDIGALEKITGAATWTLTIASTNPTACAMTITPVDNNTNGDGTTGGPLTRIYNDGVVVTVTAPATCSGNIFTSWIGVNQSPALGLGDPLSSSTWMSSDRTITANYTDPPVGDVVAWWKMDEGATTNIADSSGTGNTGTLSGSYAWSTYRGVNVVLFDGGTSDVLVAASSTLSFTVTNAFTIVASVLPSAQSNNGVIVENNTGATSWGLSSSTTGYCGGNRPFGLFFHSAIEVDVCAASPLSTTVATRLGVTYDGTDFKLYRNGVLENTVYVGAIVDTGVAGTVQIGESQFGENYTGKIWDVKVWNIALTAAQMAVLAPTRLATGGAIAMGGKIAGN